ncbi:hypothetical protein GDO81_029727, partial [Engystomops pustulosus]
MRLGGPLDPTSCFLPLTPLVLHSRGSWDTSVRVWDVRSRSEVKTLCGHTEGVTCLLTVHLDESEQDSSDLLPLGEPLVCSGSSDSSIRVW